KAADEVSDGVFTSLLPSDKRVVDKGPSIFAVTQVSLVLQYPERGQDCGVGEGDALGKALDDIGDSGGSLSPDHFHQPQFGVGEVRRFFSAHGSCLRSIKELIVPS